MTYYLEKGWTWETTSCSAVLSSEAEVQAAPPVVYVVAT